MRLSRTRAAVAGWAAGLCLAAGAQPIERVRLTDNDLGCQQIYGEIVQMDGLIAKAAAQAAQPTVADPGAGQGAAVAGAVAQSALATVAARSGGLGGFGGLGSMFGNIAAQAAQQQATQQAVAQAGAQQQAQQGALLAQQAQGRKEHLTGLFLSKGCKMGELQK